MLLTVVHAGGSRAPGYSVVFCFQYGTQALSLCRRFIAGGGCALAGYRQGTPVGPYFLPALIAGIRKISYLCCGFVPKPLFGGADEKGIG